VNLPAGFPWQPSVVFRIKPGWKDSDMSENFEMTTLLPAPPEVIYTAWLEGEQVAAFTGSAAEGDALPGSKFTAWDGYISGTNLELDPPRRILQAWRTTEFPEGSPDSRLELLLEPAAEGTTLRLLHSNIPEGQGEDYRTGWEEYYFSPLKEYFSQ
jgi:activator of HSP90 ATPase